MSDLLKYHGLGNRFAQILQRHMHPLANVHKPIHTWIGDMPNAKFIEAIIDEYKKVNAQHNERFRGSKSVQNDISAEEKMFLAFKEFMENQSKPK
jgi:hypothetical protein